jgi:hypothetical protein
MDQNTNDQGTQQQGQEQGSANSDCTALFSTKAEAEAAKPAKAPKGMRPFECSKGGVVLGWINARGYDHALSMLAKREGFTVSTGAPKTPVSKEQAVVKVLEMSDEEWKQLVAARKAAAKK